MSQATPFIAKITFSSMAGPFTDSYTGSSVFAIYDNSGNAPSAPLLPGGSVSSSCIMKTLAGPGVSPLPAYVVQSYTISPLNLNLQLTFDGHPPLSLFIGQYVAALLPGLAALMLPAWTILSSGAATFIGSAGYIGANPLGMKIDIVAPGAPYQCNYYASQPGPAPLAFDGVDLSGEDYSYSPGSPGKTFFSRMVTTWAWANLSNTRFGGLSILDAAFDNAILNGTDFTASLLGNCSFKGATGTSPNFSFAFFSDVSFAGTEIVTPLFTRAVFDTADFSNASLPNTNFSNAYLVGIHFNNGNFANAQFTGATLNGAVFDGATLTGVDFSNLDLRGASFKNANLANTNFTGAQLQGTQFTNTDITQVNFGPNPQFSTDPTNRTSFAGSTIPIGFNGNNWSCLDLSGFSFPAKPATITGLNAQSARLCGVDFSGITFLASEENGNPANFSNAFLANADFSNTWMNSAVFSSAHCEGESGSEFITSAIFTGANLEDAQFDGAFLSGVDFSYALLWGGQATLAQATLVDTNFANAYLASAQFTGLMDAQCGGVSFTGACLVNADFTGTTLQNGAKSGAVMFDGAFLQGAIFTQATFSAVNLGGAVLATQGGSIAVAFLTRPPGSVPGVFPINYQPTTLLAAQTTGGTLCVNGTMGPCNAAAIAPPTPMPSTWTQPAH